MEIDILALSYFLKSIRRWDKTKSLVFVVISGFEVAFAKWQPCCHKLAKEVSLYSSYGLTASLLSDLCGGSKDTSTPYKISKILMIITCWHYIKPLQG
jgi:hypothetical protein